MSNTDVLEAVKKQFPAAKTTMACIAWYKSDLRKKKLIPGRNASEQSLDEKITALRLQLIALELQQPVEEEPVEEEPVEEEPVEEEPVEKETTEGETVE